MESSLKRENLPPDDKIKICSKHFDSDQFELDKQVSVLFIDNFVVFLFPM